MMISGKDEFENQLLLLQQFANRHERLPRPDEDQVLHDWAMEQERTKRIAYVPTKHIIKVTGNGRKWLRSEEVWNERLSLFQKFIEQHNCLPAEETDYTLTRWFKAQMKALHLNLNLPPLKKELLLELKESIISRKLTFPKPEFYVKPAGLKGLSAEPATDTVYFSNKEKQPIQESRKSITKVWLHTFIELVIFREQQGRWPDLLTGDRKEKSLATWCYSMRYKYSEGLLGSIRIEYLQGIRFPFAKP